MTREINWDRAKLKNVEYVIKLLAWTYGVKISEDDRIWTLLELLHVNIGRVQIEKKAKILGIPVHKVTFQRKKRKTDEPTSTI